MEEYAIITNNERWIWKNVHAFARKQSGYGTLCCEEDDLYQECIVYLLAKYQRSGLPASEFKVSDLDLRHVMCQYNQSLLPVKVPQTTRNYTETMRRYNATATQTAPAEEAYCMDYVFPADVARFADTLKESHKELFALVCKGYSWTEISKITDMSRSAVYRVKRSIAEAYAAYMDCRQKEY